MDNPTIITRYNNQSIYKKEWLVDDKHHRENDLPAIEMYNRDGVIIEQHWYKNGKLHRDNDKPAVINNLGQMHYKEGVRYYFEDLSTTREEILYNGGRRVTWFKNNKILVDNEIPSIIIYRVDNSISSKQWKDRTGDKPCIEHYFESGSLKEQHWKKDDSIHILTYNTDGDIDTDKYEDSNMLNVEEYKYSLLSGKLISKEMHKYTKHKDPITEGRVVKSSKVGFRFGL